MFKLDRSELLKAIAFLKTAIMVSEELNALEYVHVKTMGERCQLTAANGYCGKRVTLFQPQQLSFEEEEKPLDQEFMIDKPMLLTYDQLLREHKKVFAKAAKADHTLNHIDIGPETLESHKDVLRYNQPKLSYPDIDKYFVEGNFVLNDLRFNPQLVIDTLKEFPGVVYVSFEEHEKYSGFPQRVYLQIETGEYQAFFFPAIPRDAAKHE